MISTDAIGSSAAPREAIKHQKTSEITYAFHIWVFFKKLHHVTIATISENYSEIEIPEE
jgi:hypothetical protein